MSASLDRLESQVRRAYDLHRGGRSREAVGLLVGAIKEHPASTAPYKLLADVQRALGNWSAETAVLEELAVMEPLNAATWGRLGSLHHQRGRSEEALRAYLRATHLMPSESAHWEGLAATALSAQQLERAAETSEQMLKHFPDAAAAHIVAGHVHKARGDVVQSKVSYEAALALNPNSSEAIYNRVDLDPPSPNDALTRRIEKMLTVKGVHPPELANLNYALGRIYEAAADYGRAFLHYETANAAMVRVMSEKGIVYRNADAESWVERIRENYPTSAPSRGLESLPIKLKLIFIVGMPRSGTTLIEQILSSHPRVSAGGELSIAGECELLFDQRRKELGRQGPVDPQNPNEHRLLAEIRELYIDRLFARDLDADFITDKQPGNFGRLGFVRSLFPEAAFIHCRRHPIATCWSLFSANFAAHEPYYNTLEHLAHYYACYERLMSHWQEVLSPSVTDIDYEELVANPGKQIERLLMSVGLEWDERCLQFHENPRPVITASYRQVRSPIYKTSLERWRPFESRLGALAALSGQQRSILAVV